jgi:hypothetical protein
VCPTYYTVVFDLKFLVDFFERTYIAKEELRSVVTTFAIQVNQGPEASKQKKIS